jgi:hypothetical protein
VSNVLARKNRISEAYVPTGLPFGLDSTHEWYLLGAVQIPVKGPRPYDFQLDVCLARNYRARASLETITLSLSGPGSPRACLDGSSIPPAGGRRASITATPASPGSAPPSAATRRLHSPLRRGQ